MNPLKSFAWGFVLLVSWCWWAAPAGADSFDLRNVGGISYVTPVQDQDPADAGVGSCWSFASVAAMESNLLRQGLVTDPTSPNVKLSEWHMVTTNGYNSPCLTYNATYGYEPPGYNWGGDQWYATYYLARGSGAVLNSQAPYPLADIQQHLDLTAPPAVMATAWRLKQMTYYDNKSPDFRSAVKTALQNSGAAYTSLYWDPAYLSDDHTYYYNGAAQSQNHALAIVGWDDAKVTASANPGAWIVKDSSGTGLGDSGFYWLAYDSVSGVEEASFFVGAAIPATLKVYNETTAVHNEKSAIPYTAAKFLTQQAGEQLRAVGFFTNLDSVSYEIRIYDDKTGNTFSNQLGSTLTGNLARQGYFVEDLPTPVGLGTVGNDYYVWLKLTGNGNVQTFVSGGSTAGLTFYSNDGSAWTDANDAGYTFDLKASTVVPEPTTVLLLTGSLLVLIRRSRGKGR